MGDDFRERTAIVSAARGRDYRPNPGEINIIIWRDDAKLHRFNHAS